MKRTIAILLAAMVLTGALTACSGTVGMDDRGAYGNVSTTPDGRVNSHNRTGSYSSQGGSSGSQGGSGSQNSGSRGSGSGAQGGGMQGGSGMWAGGSQGGSSGTGMTGGR